MPPKRHIFVIILGYTLLVIGVIGVIAPILPGWPLIIPGLLLIGEESPVGKWVYDRLPAKAKDIFNRKKNAKKDHKLHS